LAGASILSFSNAVSLSIIAVLLLASGMGVANAAVFKLVSVYVPKAVGGAAGWVGGLGAFGGFVLPPVMGAIVERFGTVGYARGFLVFAALAVVNLAIIFMLTNKKKTELAHPQFAIYNSRQTKNRQL